MRDLELCKRLLAQARPYGAHIAVLFLIGSLSAPLALLGPVPLRIAVDSVLGDKPLPAFLLPVVPDALAATRAGSLMLATALVVLTALLLQLQGLAVSMLRTWTSERLVQSFRARLFQHVQRISLLYHDTRGSSDAAYRIQQDASAIQAIAIDGVIPLVTSAATV